MSYHLSYLEHLSDRDLELLGQAAGDELANLRSRLRTEPRIIDELLSSPALFDLVFVDSESEVGVRVTPFLVFGILVNRVLADLESASYTYEWAGRGQRLPVFDVESMYRFLDDGRRRMFLIEFLASFTRISSGSVRVRTRRGYRRQRYSELDPVRMSEMVESLPAPHRPGGYRRLGDIALFLSGVFPDHTAGHPIPPIHRERLVRSAGVDQSVALTSPSDVDFLEEIGAGWYRRAFEAATALVGSGPPALKEVAEGFRPARRILNYLADTYLHHYQGGLSRPA